jgi:hypothetical protein
VGEVEVIGLDGNTGAHATYSGTPAALWVGSRPAPPFSPR